MPNKRYPIAVLISGGGTTLENLIQESKSDLAFDIRAVVSSNPSAGGLEFAKSADIPTHVVQRSAFQSPTDFREAIFDVCRAANVKLVVMGGFLKHLLIPKDFAGRVINIHPSFIPEFCGKGFYGKRVHEAVLAAGVAKSGCTVHIVDDEYDHGPIVRQRTVDVRPDDTPSSLADRVFEQECELLPEVIRLFASGKVCVDRECVHIETS